MAEPMKENHRISGGDHIPYEKRIHVSKSNLKAKSQWRCIFANTHNFIHPRGCIEKLLYVYQKMDILSMILSDSVREESFINNDMGVLTPTLLCPLTKSIVLKTQEDLLLG